MKTITLLFTVLIISINSMAQIPTNGLVGYWPFSGNSNDESGNGLNAVSNTGSFISDRNGMVNSAIALNGIDQMITLPGATSLNSDTFSINFWTLANSYSVHNPVVMGNIGAELRWSLYWEQSFMNFTPMTCAGGYGIGNLINIGSPLSIWNNMCFVTEGRNTKFYMNGVLIGQQNTADSLLCFLPNMNIYFGGDIGGGSIEYYNGNFDDIGIWSRALSDSEVNQIFNSTITTSCTTGNLPVSLASGIMAWHPFCGNPNDESGNGNNGIANGPLLTQDRFGNANSAYQFNGTSDYILTSLMPPAGKNSRTISFWAKTNDPNIMVPMDYGDANANGGSFDLIFNSPCEGFGLDVGDGVVTRGDTSLLNNNWHHCVLLYDSAYGNTISNARMFIDGIEQSSVSCSAIDPNAEIQTIAANPLNIGRAFTNVRFFHGDLDDIGVWNRILTNQEILNLYQTGICFQNVTVTDTLIINANITGFNPVTYQHSIKIYPNPAYDHITIDNGSNYATLAGYTLRIDNSLAQTVYSTVVTQQIYSIDLSTWNGNGIYFVYLINSTGHIVDVKKIVIQ